MASDIRRGNIIKLILETFPYELVSARIARHATLALVECPYCIIPNIYAVYRLINLSRNLLLYFSFKVMDSSFIEYEYQRDFI